MRHYAHAIGVELGYRQSRKSGPSVVPDLKLETKSGLTH